MSTTLGCKDIKTEFVTKTQFLYRQIWAFQEIDVKLQFIRILEYNSDQSENKKLICKKYIYSNKEHYFTSLQV